MEPERYVPGVMADTELLGWWLHLGETGDLELCFGRQACALTEFVRGIGQSELWFVKDDHGWTATIWADRLLAGAAIGLWVRSDKRQSPESLRFIIAVLEDLFSRYPVLLFASRNVPLVRQAQTFGFIPMGEIPYLFDGDSCAIAYATPFTYEGARNGGPDGRQNA